MEIGRAAHRAADRPLMNGGGSRRSRPARVGSGRLDRSGPVRFSANGRSRELRIARGFAECRGLSTEQLEDLYQETALALYKRAYDSEEHLRNALRDGIKKRALRLHRDERRHGRILARRTPGFRVMAEAREREGAPELAALAREDRLIASEFLTELTEQEQRVFGCWWRGWRTGRSRPRWASRRTRLATSLARATASASVSSCSTTRAACAGIAHRRSTRCRTGKARARSWPSARSRTLRAAHTADWSTRRTPSGCGAASATRPQRCSRPCSSGISAGSRGSVCEPGCWRTGSGSTAPRSGRAACANAPSHCWQAVGSARKSPRGSSPSAWSQAEQSPRTSLSRAPHRTVTTSRHAQQPRPRAAPRRRSGC